MQVGSLITTVVLARLLDTSDIGVVAGAAVVIGLLEVLTDVGFAATVVQRRSVDQVALSTLFWASTGMGALVAVAAAASAPYWADGLGEGRSSGILVAVALLTSATFARSVPNGLLRRAMRWRPFYGLTVAGVAIYGAVAIVLATATDLGPWSIVVGRAAQTAAVTAGTFAAARWRPSLAFDWDTLRADLGFNLGFWGNGLALYGSKNADYWAVGGAYGSATLGVYYVAYVLPNILRQRVTWVAQDVLLPAMSRLEDDAAIVRGYLAAARFLAFVTYPAMVGLACVSSHVVDLFFGERWRAAAGPMAVLALGSAVDATSAAANAVFLARGHPRRSLRANLVRGVVVIAGSGFATRQGHGLTAVAWVVVAGTAAAAVVWQLEVRRELGVTPRSVVVAVGPYACSAIAMAAVVLGLEQLLVSRMSSVVTLGALGLIGAGTYVALGLLVFRAAFVPQLRDLRGMVGPPARPQPRPSSSA